MATKQGTITDAVRQFASGHITVTRKKVVDELGYNEKQVSTAFCTLLNQGYLKKIKHGLYEFKNGSNLGREKPVEDKIWHAIRINPEFTAAEIARQAGSTENYVSIRIRAYRDEGLVKQRRRKKNTSGTSTVKVWGLTEKGRAMIERPRFDAFKPDPIVEKVCKLNRLVCTGRAKRNVTDRKVAIKLMDEIKIELQEDFCNG